MTALHYVRGEWTEGDDPVGDAAVKDFNGDIVKALKADGYSQWAHIGMYPESPFIVNVYTRRPGPPPFAVFELEGNHDALHHVYAGDLADTMELLRQWAPIAQSAAIVDLIRRLDTTENTRANDFAGLIELARTIAT